MLLEGTRAWLKSLNKDVSSIRQNVSENNSNPYYWKELKKKIEVMDLNFLEFNTYAVDKMDLKHGFHMKLELKDEYTDKIVESARNNKKNL